MKIYYYCSYDDSPTGFHIGTLSSDSQKELCPLSEEGINSFIRYCLECSLVRSAFGVIPQSDKYFLLIKKMEAIKDNRKYYLNIAFEIDNLSEFVHMFYSNNKTQEELAEKISESVVNSISLDPKNAFGYQVLGKKLQEVRKSAWSCEDIKEILMDIKEENSAYFTLSTSTPDVEFLKDSLHLPEGDAYRFKQRSGKVWKLGKKASASVPLRHGITLAVITAILVVAVIAGYLLAPQSRN